MLKLNLNRRSLLRAAVAGAAGYASAGWATTEKSIKSPTALVEIFNFRCPRSRGVSDWSERIAAAASAKGLFYRPAPISWEASLLWADRFYYTVRDLYPEAAPIIREAFFNGLQENGQAFEDLPQLVAYLQSYSYDVKAAVASKNFDIATVVDRATTDDSLYPIAKAVRLLEQVNAEEVPVFLWIKGGEIVKAISPSDASDPAALAKRVISEITAT